MDTLTFSSTMPGGQPGTDSTGQSPYARALRNLLETGQTFLGMSQCHVSARGGPLRWVGVFVQTESGRVLFFPGVADKMVGAESGSSSKGVRKNAPIAIDHLTLEANRASWHATSARSKTRINGTSTIPLGDGRVLWFGMSVAECTSLQAAYETTLVTAEVHESDSRRRTEVFAAAVKDRTSLKFELDSPWPDSTTSTFLHFCAIVGPRGFVRYEGPELGLPRPNPHTRGALTPVWVKNSEARALSDTVDIQLLCVQASGQILDFPIMFTTPISA